MFQMLRAYLPVPIRVGYTASADAFRSALVATIFSGAGLPSTGSDRITADITDPLVALGTNSSNTAQVDYHELDIFDNGPSKIGTTEFWLFRPTDGNNRLVVLLLGHSPEGISANTGNMAHELIDAGYTVALGQPFPNINSSGGSGFNDVGTHNALPSPTSALNPLRYFVQGPIRIVNELESEGFDFVFGVGQSGGGWEMSLWPAIDVRVKASCSHAGYLPLYMKNVGGSSSRDWEQFLPSLKHLTATGGCDYTDLAILCCHPGRKHTQSLNDQDPSVFTKAAYDSYQPYADAVSREARKYGGAYSLSFDSNNQHTYVPARRAAIVALFDSF